MIKKYFVHGALFTLVYGALGILVPLIGAYLDSKGFTGTQIGAITATGTLVSIFAAAFWGMIYTQSRSKKRVVGLLYFACAFVAVFLMKVDSYAVFLMMFGVLYFFQAPAMPLLDSMALENGLPFGNIRKWGAIGFSLAVFVAGKAAALLGNEMIFPLYGVCFSMAILVLFLSGDWGKDKSKVSSEHAKIQKPIKVIAYQGLCKNRYYLLLLISTFFVGGTNAANNTYFSFLFLQAGGSIAAVGLAFLLMAGSEAVVMAFVDRMEKRFGIEKMILFAMCLSAVRYFWYSTCPYFTLILAAFFLQGLVNGIILVQIVKQIGRVVSPDCIGGAVSIYYAVSVNCSTIVCQILGGIILDYFNSTRVYLFFSAYNLIGVVLFIIFGLHKEAKTLKN